MTWVDDESALALQSSLGWSENANTLFPTRRNRPTLFLRAPLLSRYNVAQHPHPADVDLDDVAGRQPQRRLPERRHAPGGTGQEQVTGRERGELRDVGD